MWLICLFFNRIKNVLGIWVLIGVVEVLLLYKKIFRFYFFWLVNMKLNKLLKRSFEINRYVLLYDKFNLDSIYEM